MAGDGCRRPGERVANAPLPGKLVEQCSQGAQHIRAANPSGDGADQVAPFPERLQAQPQLAKMACVLDGGRRLERIELEQDRLKEGLLWRIVGGRPPGDNTVIDDALMGGVLVDEVHAVRAFSDHIGEAHLSDDTQERQDLAMRGPLGRRSPVRPVHARLHGLWASQGGNRGWFEASAQGGDGRCGRGWRSWRWRGAGWGTRVEP